MMAGMQGQERLALAVYQPVMDSRVNDYLKQKA
jgi:hypothetical protein